MTKPEFTPSGIQVQTFQEIYDELAAGYRSIYGEDINLDPDSPDGQRVAIEAQARLDLQSFGALLYQQIDPDFALGQRLNSLIKLSGITRRPATRSQVDVTLTTDRPLTLPADYAVEDDLGQAWTTLSTVDVLAGANTVTLFAENFGAVEADAGTVTEPVTFVIGVLSVTNPAAATVGRDEETDEELRVRRNRSLQNPATSTVGGLFTVIGNLPGVTDLAVYENDQDTTDTERNIPPHTIWAVVEGGAVDEIVEAIAKNKTGGTGLKGTVEGTYIETLQKPNGDEFQIFHTMKFDRPTEVPIFVQVTVTRKVSADPVDIELIKQTLAARVFRIGDNVIASDLYRTIYQAGDNFVATDMQISEDNITFIDGRIESAPDEKFTIATTDITVTEIIP
jgi:uncharacterized phage protein gp47/JayE